ncbi:DUF4394 domain-containing protein [Micromonospora sp. SH-82]|uniref:DUF4394 domain-containing protein n=1 Tax=Micromonospora sp. SH-82 TaxID=3132938 RepID=UPI003EBEF80C
MTSRNHSRMVLAGLSIALGAGMSGALAAPASADVSTTDAAYRGTYLPGLIAQLEKGRPDRGLRAIGLTQGQRLVRFDVDRPGSAELIGRVRLTGGEDLVGIDYRVQDGRLYGVGDEGGVFVLSTRTAVATRVGRLSVALQGSFFGVDFNPAADRLRIISDEGQNLRHNVNDGTTIVDGTLTYPPSATTARGVTGAAYTNNDLDSATATTLFDIDTLLDQVAVQSPANSGQLAATGRLGVDSGIRAGFDIYSTVRGGRTVANEGFAVLPVDGRRTVFSVDALTGTATPLGSFRGYRVTDIALPLGQR